MRRLIGRLAIKKNHGWTSTLSISSLSSSSSSSLSGIPSLSDGPMIPGIVEDIRPQTAHRTSRCIGCGVQLQSLCPTATGYVPPAVISKYSDGRLKRTPHSSAAGEDVMAGAQFEVVVNETAPCTTRVLICQRCYKLQHYRYRTEQSSDKISPVERSTRSLGLGDISNTIHPADLIERIVYAIRPKSLVLHFVDIMDFEGSLVPELHEACRKKHLDVLWVVNKIDCLPEGSRNIDQLLRWIRKLSRQMGDTPMDDIAFISSATGFNFPLLEKMMHAHIDENNAKYIYVVGRVNTGKSTFVNRFLNFIGYKHLGTLNFRNQTGGVTQSTTPGTTLDFIPFSLPKGFKLIDSPGIPSQHQMSSVLKEDSDIERIVHQSTVHPTFFKLKEGMSLLIGGLARVDFISGETVIIGCFFTKYVTLQLCPTPVAVEVISHKIGKQLRPPSTSEAIDGLFRRHSVQLHSTMDDISISGLGWLSIKGTEGNKLFDVRVPDTVRVFRRPALPIHYDKKNKIIHSSGSVIDSARGTKEMKKLERWRRGDEK